MLRAPRDILQVGGACAERWFCKVINRHKWESRGGPLNRTIGGTGCRISGRPSAAEQEQPRLSVDPLFDTASGPQSQVDHRRQRCRLHVRAMSTAMIARYSRPLQASQGSYLVHSATFVLRRLQNNQSGIDFSLEKKTRSMRISNGTRAYSTGVTSQSRVSLLISVEKPTSDDKKFSIGYVNVGSFASIFRMRIVVLCHTIVLFLFEKVCCCLQVCLCYYLFLLVCFVF